jgi:zinc D-Ala-D-Ala carboxypeptidase
VTSPERRTAHREPLRPVIRSLAVAVVAVLALTGAASPRHSSDTTSARSAHVLVNKQNPLRPKTYVPADLVHPRVPATYSGALLRKKPARQVEIMFAAYRRATGRTMTIVSAYRSYSSQVRVYGGYAAREGRGGADRHSARPGYSEHQTGLAFDIGAGDGSCSLGSCFGRTSQGRWLAANAWRYGFVLRYPKGDERVTGYVYEPWHYRYVGVDVATAMHRGRIATLERYYGYGAAPSYR